jgi:gas vesicle protein
MPKKRSGNLAAGALIAAAAGYVAGILTAPKSGKETRKDIQTAASKAKAESEKKLKELYAELSGLVDTAKTKVKTASTSAKTEIDKAVNAAQSAMTKAGDLLSAVREGEADDKELKQAIKEAEAATKHLKEYLAKDAKKPAAKATKS